jgi:hypothetical protein
MKSINHIPSLSCPSFTLPPSEVPPHITSFTVLSFFPHWFLHQCSKGFLDVSPLWIYFTVSSTPSITLPYLFPPTPHLSTASNTYGYILHLHICCIFQYWEHNLLTTNWKALDEGGRNGDKESSQFKAVSCDGSTLASILVWTETDRAYWRVILPCSSFPQSTWWTLGHLAAFPQKALTCNWGKLFDCLLQLLILQAVLCWGRSSCLRWLESSLVSW